MCGLFLTGPESRSVFEEARSLEVLTPGYIDGSSPVNCVNDSLIYAIVPLNIKALY